MIVMADDDLDDQDLVKSAFAQSNVNVTVYPVYDGIQLLDFLYRRYQFKHIKQFPDLILLDLNMPLMDGFEALRRIKGDPATAHIPVYVVTTSRTKEDKEMASKLGAAGFYTKGASSKDIQKIVKEVCFECFQ